MIKPSHNSCDEMFRQSKGRLRISGAGGDPSGAIGHRNDGHRLNQKLTLNESEVHVGTEYSL